MVILVGVAVAMVASSLWMAIGPQLPGLRAHRGLLAALTWCATRGLALLVACTATSGAARVLANVAGQGLLPGEAAHAASPIDAAARGAWLVLLLAGDFVTWRLLAADTGDGGELAWSWAASPLAPWVGLAWGAPRVLAVAPLALALALSRRGRDGACGFALGVAAAWGGPVALAAATAIGLAPGHRAARVPGAVVAAVAVLAVLHALAPASWGVAWVPPASAGGGITVWRLLRAWPGLVPSVWSAIACGVVTLGGLLLLARRDAEGPEMAAWTFGALALLAPALPARELLFFAPLLAAWTAGDPDRRGWWFLESLALALAVVLDHTAFADGTNVVLRMVGVATVAGAVVLALWPARTLVGPPTPAGALDPVGPATLRP